MGESIDYSDHLRCPPDQLERFVREVLGSVEVPEHIAEVVAAGLIRADLRGVDSHGIARFPAYVQNFASGGFNTSPEVTFDWISPSASIFDADDGPGHWIGRQAIDAVIEASKDLGIACATVKNSNHFGTAAFYTERASAAGCIGIAMTNAEPAVIPFGGRQPALGTNPIGCSVPTGKEFDFTLDMSTSIVPTGKIDHVAMEQANPSIPDTWAVDEQANTVTDPANVAAVRPLGGPKGYGLGLLVDILSGVLSGAGPSDTCGPLYGDYEEPLDIGHFFLAIDIATFRAPDRFEREMDNVIDRLKSIPAADGFDEVRIPGEIESIAKRENERRGVPLRPGVVENLIELGEIYDVDTPEEISTPS